MSCDFENGPLTVGETDPGVGHFGSRTRGPWLLPFLLSLVLAGMLLASRPWTKCQPDGTTSGDREGPHAGLTTGGSRAQGSWTPAPRPASETVSLTIDFGNGARRTFAALPWHDGIMLADLMAEARHFRPSITYAQTGTGAQAFLTSLEGVAQQAGQGNFWFYEINGKRGTCSFGVQPLNPGDRVLWTFGPQE